MSIPRISLTLVATVALFTTACATPDTTHIPADRGASSTSVSNSADTTADSTTNPTQTFDDTTPSIPADRGATSTSVSNSGDTTAHPTTNPTSVDTQTFTNAGKATFDDLTVELLPHAQEGTAEHASFQVEVCVIHAVDPEPDGTTRVSTDPWTATTTGEAILNARPSTEFTPAYSAEARLKEGECARGWIEFVSDAPYTAIASLNYRNASGDSAQWTN